jgi:uncharacterized membrane protein YfcA
MTNVSDLNAIDAGYPPPPRMHWAVLLVLSIVTVGVFASLWAVFVAYWLQKVRRKSVTLVLFGIAALLAVGQLVFQYLVPRQNLSEWFGLFGVIVWIIAAFSMRRDLLKQYNEDEPIGLSLGIWMTLFFSIYYFQYHLREIALFKREQAIGGAQSSRYLFRQ